MWLLRPFRVLLVLTWTALSGGDDLPNECLRLQILGAEVDVCEEWVFQSLDEGSVKVGGLMNFPGELVKSSMLFLLLVAGPLASRELFSLCMLCESRGV